MGKVDQVTQSGFRSLCSPAVVAHWIYIDVSAKMLPFYPIYKTEGKHFSSFLWHLCFLYACYRTDLAATPVVEGTPKKLEQRMQVNVLVVKIVKFLLKHEQVKLTFLSAVSRSWQPDNNSISCTVNSNAHQTGRLNRHCYWCSPPASSSARVPPPQS